jgi:predicted acetyltransferase
MSWKAVPMEPGELAEASALLTTVFGRGPVPSEAIRREIDLVVEPDRMFVVHDGPAVVGSGGSYSFDLALPGGAAVPMQAITQVGVAPTHRRRGILRAVMRAVVDQAVERGEPVAGLTASEATIYRRFGFGVATRFQTLSVDNRRLRLAEAVVGDRGVGREPAADPSRLRLASAADAASLLPTLWARSWRRSPGELSRNAGYWAALDLDPEEDRDGATARFVVVHADAAGEPDGAASYRLQWKWASGGDNVLAVEDVVATSDAVEAALLRYLLDVDLVNRVEWHAAPVDHPLRWWLADPRAVSVTREQDHLWLRPLDVARCLSSRSYATTDALVVEVIDDDRPAVGGRFRLDAGPEGAACARTTDDPDLALAVADLGALLLGGVSWAALHRVGLVEERTSGGVARADALFRPERPPYCGTDF